MDLLTVAEEARIRRAAYIAVLRGELGAFETREAFAARIGRARVYLESLLDEDRFRTPGPAITHEIVQALPLEPEQRQDLLDQMLLAAQRRLKARRDATMSVAESSPDEVIAGMREAHWAASYSQEPAQVRAHYRELCDTGELFLRSKRIGHHPLVAAEASLVLHDVLSVLNRPGEALVQAMSAAEVMKRLDPGNYPRSRERLEHLRVNAHVAEAVSLTSLGLANRAEVRLLLAEATFQRSSSAAAFWAPHIARGRLAAHSKQNRFNLYEAVEFARQVKEICDRRGDRFDPQFSLLADVSLARAYIRYGTEPGLKKARLLLRDPIERLDEVPELGALRRAIALRTYARVCWELKARDEWELYLGRAWQVAIEAGLDHQLASMRREYGVALQSLDLPTSSSDSTNEVTVARCAEIGEHGPLDSVNKRC